MRRSPLLGRVRSAQAIGHWWASAQGALPRISSEAHQEKSPTQHRCRFLFFFSLSFFPDGLFLYNLRTDIG
jgi:hypothetical protein